jgi:hypothetical protein
MAKVRLIMRRKILYVLMLVIALAACSQTVTLHKRVGDEIKIKVSIAGAQAHKFVGCDIQYPASVMAPTITQGNMVSFLDGDVYAGLDFETLCTKGTNSVTLSRVLRSGGAVANNGLVATIYFKCLSAGTGTITITNGDIGYIDSNGSVVKYNSTSTPLNFTNEIPATVTFSIEIL